MRYFDFHTHAFTDALAERAVSGLSDTSGITPATDGTVAGLRRKMAENGIDRALLLPVATKPSQQTTINNWAAEIMGDGLYCCGTVHPDAEDAVQEAERIKSLGLYGVKFHSEYQKFAPNEKRMFPVYEKIAELGLIAVFHGGWDPYSDDVIRATPQSFAALAEAFPQLTIVAAHLGGLGMWDDVERYTAGKYENLWFDVGVISRYIEDEQLLRIIRKQGADKVLFGSDCPWDDPANEIAMINRLPLTEKEKELIFHENAERLLKLR
ncbi:amidohydrolase family protein [Ruminococcus sp.]|uniref:amidohydrolase family protein n=1 Tax=Ruminococcus sp. TaxID=41978 RepID=UPI002BEA8E46|nr:amidohydrolase family protein [Ruminococcus sp.]HOA00603.1 amidohydrolase family protein [Ruminococcus sp.]HOH88035.1 amidohydrolase family protein [Ruminococcus sp.]